MTLALVSTERRVRMSEQQKAPGFETPIKLEGHDDDEGGEGDDRRPWTKEVGSCNDERSCGGVC